MSLEVLGISEAWVNFVRDRLRNKRLALSKCSSGIAKWALAADLNYKGPLGHSNP